MGLFNWIFSRMCRQVFKLVDHDNNGKLTDLEVELAVLQLYNIVNKRFPGWANPPSRKQIQAAFAEFDTDLSGSLDPVEFERFAKSIVKLGPDALFARMGRRALVQSALLPAATMAAQRFAGGKIANTPLHVLSPLLGIVGSVIRGLSPW